MTEQQRELTEAEVVPDTTEPDIPEADVPAPPAESDDFDKPPDFDLEDERADFPDAAYDDVDEDEDVLVGDEPDQDDPEDETPEDEAQ